MTYYTILGKEGTLCRCLLNPAHFEWSFEAESKKRTVMFNTARDCERYLLSINLNPENYLIVENDLNL